MCKLVNVLEEDNTDGKDILRGGKYIITGTQVGESSTRVLSQTFHSYVVLTADSS